MFYLSRIERTLAVPPSFLHLPIVDAIKGQLEKLFVDKVVANLGLCISIYDIRSIDGGFIFPGNGAATYKVVFTLIVFRPFVGEIIVAKVKDYDANGLQLSLGFFDDIFVPSHLLPKPSKYKPDPENGGKLRWVWEYDRKKHDIYESDEVDRQAYDIYESNEVDHQAYDIYEADEIKFRVYKVNYPPLPVPVEQPEENVKPVAPMVITGTIKFEGLGLLSWW